IDVFLHEDAVFGVVVDPCNDNVFASAGDDGRILIWDIREPSHHEPFVLANYATSFHAVVYHPMESRFLATANCKEGLALWDVRKPRSSLLRYSGVSQQSAMSVCFDQLGRRLLGLRRRLPPVLYDLHNAVPTYQFDHSGYYNSCTMKTGCFAGDKHQYVVSGSDDFNLYVWQVPEGPVEEGWVGEAHMVLQGHRSIVNQVCFNRHTHMIASSGVEKVIKLWSPFALPDSRGNVRGDQDLWEVDRPMYNRGEYLNLMMNSSSALSYDYSNQSMEEDPRMIAFFDSLVQREVDGGFSDSSDSYVSTDQMLLSVTDFQLIDVDNQSDSDSLSPDTTIILQLERQQQESTDGNTERQQPKVGASGESQEPSTIDSLTASGSNHGTKRAAADSSSSDSDLTDTDEEGRRLFERYCAKQRELYRKNRRRKRMKQTNQQIDSNKLVSLRQRLACKKALKHKMHKKSTKTSSVKIVIGSASSDEEEETVTKNTLPLVQNAPTAHQDSVRSLRRRIAFVRNQDDLDGQKTETRDHNVSAGNEGHSSSGTAGKQQTISGVSAGSDSEDQPSCSWDVSHHEREKAQNLQAQLSFENENKDSDNNDESQGFKRKQKKSKRQYRSNKRD
ncbi:DDB1- and CUL4-associated factor 5-like, partial [Anneissia japonica]|uniref:DDB1- and CUL4-associated factor 5-like n=1 Tax=Anneissia japonica TaxID=1529436 RepID=UPI0014256C00